MSTRLLIVDNDEEMISFMQAYFIQEGYAVSIADNSELAMEKAGENPDVILLDIMLPNIDSLSLYKQIRKKTQCPILFFMSKHTVPDKDNIFYALNLSRENVIVMPFSVAELNTRVKTILRRQKSKQGQHIYKWTEKFPLPFFWFYRKDKQLFDFFAHKLRNPCIEKMMILFTRLGDGGLIWFLIAFLGCLSPATRRTGLVTIASAVSCAAVSFILKFIFKRTRPFLHYWPQIPLKIKHPLDASFPSGHTSVSFASAGILATLNLPIAICVLIIAALIAFSRLYLMVHYPSDIIGGFILGSLFAFGFSFLL